MKKFSSKLLVSIILLCGLQTNSYSQNTGISYQGVARSATGAIISNQAISIRFTILQGSASGSVVYQETHNTTTNALGLFDVQLTKGASTTGTFDPAKWQVLAGLHAFLKTELDITGGTNYVDMGTTQLLSVPFAQYAESSGAAIGSVTYAGTWDASTNDPALTSHTGTKGYYYVVTNAGSSSLDGINDWKLSDWAIFNGTKWEKVDNSESPVSAGTVSYTPDAHITATNVQDAIEELDNETHDPSHITQDATHRFVTDTEKSTWNGKVSKSGDTMTGDLILNADPVAALGAATKQYVDDNIASVSNSKVSKSGDTMTGDLILNADPVAALGAATKQYVDDNTASVSNSKVSKSGDTMTGDLILNADPVAALGAATKQYVDDNTASVSNSKVSKSGDTMTGDLILNADPVAALGAATKQYVDDQVSAVAASHVGFTASTGITATNVQDAITEVDGKFSTLIDSYIHKTEDGVTVYLAPGETRKRFGIGDTEPTSPLGVLADGVQQRVLSFKPHSIYPGSYYSMRLMGTSTPGYNLEEDNTSSGSVSRLFIQQSTGMVGIGTTMPTQKLHIVSTDAGAVTGIKIQNAATAVNTGWILGHQEDAVVAERNGAFVVMESSSSNERLVITSSGNTGINEKLPDTKLHVSKPVSDPTGDLSLIPGTGIVVIGPMTNNIVADYRGIQARTGSYIGSDLTLSASTLNLQKLGGDILIHGDMDISDKMILTADGKIGMGTITPRERIDVNGAIMIGNAISSNEGTIRYNGTDFEGRKNGAWVSLTQGSVWSDAGTDKITYNPADPRVGIGVSIPTASLDIEGQSAVTGSNTGMRLYNHSQTASAIVDDYRIGIEIKNTGTWSTNPAAKNIGIYVSNVSGQANAESNIAAVFNGNVVVGGLSSSAAIGTGGTNVLAIQNGTAPTVSIGSTATGGIQIYSDNISSGALAPPYSAFHLRSGNGEVIRLFRTDALTAPDNTSLGTGTYNPDVEAVINNLRTRINELEARLQAFGLLQ